jgi:hypothetical protein
VRGNSRGGQAVSRSRGNHVPPLMSRARVLFTGGCERGWSGARGGNRSDSRGVFAPDESRSMSNPQGSRRPSRGGTAPREGKALKGESQGRWGRSRRVTVGRSAPVAQGRSDDGTAGSGQLGLTGVGAAQTAEGQRKPGRGRRKASSVGWTKPGGGTGRGRGTPRLPRLVEPVAAESGHPESHVVGTRNPRRGGPERRRKLVARESGRKEDGESRSGSAPR